MYFLCRTQRTRAHTHTLIVKHKEVDIYIFTVNMKFNFAQYNCIEVDVFILKGFEWEIEIFEVIAYIKDNGNTNRRGLWD